MLSNHKPILMNKIIVSLIFEILISSCVSNNPKEIPNEVIVIVELIKNEDKSAEELKKFTKRYSDYVKSTEPNTLGWTYHDAGDKIILIERYKDEDANIITAKNISPGGNRFKLLQESFNYHSLNKVTVIGGFTQKLIDFNKVTADKVGFTAPFIYHPLISGYSRNLK